MHRTAFTFCLVVFILVPRTLAQTGFPAYGSFEQSGFDAVNRQNLNTVFAIPIFFIPGRGQSFQYSLLNNSLLWTQTTVGSTTTWTPVTNASGNPTWGWYYGPAVSSSGQLLTTLISTHTCKYLNNGTWAYATYTSYAGFDYEDWLGTIHPFSVSYIVASPAAANCGIYTTTGSGYSTDNTGYYLYASQSSTYVLGPAGIAGGAAPVDTNGNYVSQTVVNSTETDWTDTAGHLALKVFNNTSNIQYEWQDSSGNYTSATTTTMKLSTLSIKTNFACSGIGEYTGTASLPTEIDLPNGQKYLITYEATPGNSGYYTGRVKRVTLPTGGYYEYDYPTTAGDGIVCASGSINSLTRVMNDGTNTSTWTFSSASGSTTITAPVMPYNNGVANNSVYTFNSSGQQTGANFYQGTVSAANLKRYITTTWATNASPATQITVLEDGKTENEVETSYDNYGNLLSLKEHDWGTSAPGSVLRTTTITYLNASAYITANILNRPTNITVTDNVSGVVHSLTNIAYDESGYINYACHTGAPQHNDSNYGCSFTTRGNPTTMTAYTTAATQTGPVTHHSYYDNLGNLVQADMDCCQTKTWTYSSTTNYSFPSSVRSGSSPGTQLTSSATYNAYTGLMATSSDANGQQSTYSFDNLKRFTSVQLPDTNHTTLTWAYTDATPPTQSSINAGVPIQASNMQQTITTLDGLGRPVTQQMLGGTTTYSIVATQYDPIGRAYMTSNPYTSTAQYWTTSQFDVLGRPTKTLLQDNSQTTFSYATNTAIVTDPAGKARESVVDGLGRMTSVYEPDPSNGNTLSLQTSYTYNILNLLTAVSQGVQSRTYAYDDLGRATSVKTPETNQVAYQYQYTNFSLVNQRTDSRGVITTYGYDNLNRLSSISYNVGSTGVPATPGVTFTYDQGGASAFALGRLTTMADGVGSETYSYNNLGEMTQLQKIINSTTYTTAYNYNLAGELAQITYPSGRVVQQSVDAIGRFCEVAPSTTGCGTATSPFVTGLGYNAANQMTGFKYGNGIYASFGFSPDRLQLNCLDHSTTNRNGSCTHDSTTLFGLSYSFGSAGSNNGQIATITDSVDNGRSATYTYDSLYRLSAASTAGSVNYPQWGLSMTYDRYGNRTAQTVTAGTGVPSNSVAVSATTNQITTSGYAYDANGNMTNDGQNTLVYDGENRVVSATNSSSSGAYVYDGNGVRVEKCSPNCTSPTSTAVFLFSGSVELAEYDNGAAPASPTNEYINAGSQKIALISGGSTIYYHNDHLSPRMRTSSSGSVDDQRGTYPFGETWYLAPAGSPFVFTTYYRDPESGNDYAQARYNVSRLGRFSSPDPLSGSQSDPQSLNHYPYAFNDPVDFVDPSGNRPAFAPGLDPTAFGNWLFELFTIFNEPDSELDITNGSSVWNGEVWQEIDDPGAIFGLDIPGAPTWDSAMAMSGGGAQPKPPCQDLNQQSPGTFNFVTNNYDAASTLATLMGTTAANVLGVSSVESGNGTSNIATNYNNFFGLTYPFPGTGTPYASPNGRSYSTYGAPGFWNSGVSFMRSRHGTRVGAALTPQSFAGVLTTPPMAFNSEPGRYNIYLNRINLVQADIDCIFGTGH
jgi:RHS repeat-associated protein